MEIGSVGQSARDTLVSGPPGYAQLLAVTHFRTPLTMVQVVDELLPPEDWMFTRTLVLDCVNTPPLL